MQACKAVCVNVTRKFSFLPHYQVPQEQELQCHMTPSAQQLSMYTMNIIMKRNGEFHRSSTDTPSTGSSAPPGSSSIAGINVLVNKYACLVITLTLLIMLATWQMHSFKTWIGFTSCSSHGVDSYVPLHHSSHSYCVQLAASQMATLPMTIASI